MRLRRARRAPDRVYWFHAFSPWIPIGGWSAHPARRLREGADAPGARDPRDLRPAGARRSAVARRIEGLHRPGHAHDRRPRIGIGPGGGARHARPRLDGPGGAHRPERAPAPHHRRRRPRHPGRSAVATFHSAGSADRRVGPRRPLRSRRALRPGPSPAGPGSLRERPLRPRRPVRAGSASRRVRRVRPLGPRRHGWVPRRECGGRLGQPAARGLPLRLAPRHRHHPPRRLRLLLLRRRLAGHAGCGCRRSRESSPTAAGDRSRPSRCRPESGAGSGTGRGETAT